MSAWGILVARSKIPEHMADAWQHLNNQAVTLTHLDGCVGVDMDVHFYDLDIENSDIELDIDSYEIDIDLESKKRCQ